LDFTPPHAGEYRLLVAMPDQGKDFGSIPDVTLGVKGNKKAAQALPEAAP
jgi:hypothetical protein